MLVIDANNVKASVVAAGLYNPVILKRFTMAWNADEQLNFAKQFYRKLEGQLENNFIEPLEVIRRFNSVKEQNSWFTKLNNPGLSKYMSGELFCDEISGVKAAYNYGKLEGTGRILIKPLIEKYMAFLKKQDAFLNEKFDYDELKIFDGFVKYKSFEARNIIFCEGYALKQNPFFNKLPLVGNKGSYIIIESEHLQLAKALKSYYFLIPLGANQYKFGATYENHFKDVDHDKATKAHLVNELEQLISVPYKLISQETAVRPTVIDRRPLVGQHTVYEQLFVCNGMGTRGVMIAPTASKHLVNYILKNEPIPKDIDINRFNER